MNTEQLTIDKIFLNNLKLANNITLIFKSQTLRNSEYSIPSASGKVDLVLKWNDYKTQANCQYEIDNISGLLYYGIWSENSTEEILHPNEYINLDLFFYKHEVEFLTHILKPGDELSFVIAIDQAYDIYTIDLRFRIERKKESFTIPLTLIRKNIYNGNTLNYR